MKASGIGFGTWAWGNKIVWGYNPIKDDAILEETFLQAIKGGLTLIDTADSYGTGSLNGRSEELLGRFVQKISLRERQRITIATKLAPFPWRQGRNSIKKAFTKSQNRLQGKIDRVQLHWSTSRYAPWQEKQLLDGLGDLFEIGSIKEIGLSNLGPKNLEWMVAHLGKRKIPIKSVQVQLSLLTTPSKKEKQLQNICNELNIDLLAYSPLALGILTVPLDQEPKPSTFIRNNLFQRILPKTKQLRQGLIEIANSRKVSQVEVALNWCRAHGTIPIAGIRNPFQAKTAISALNWNMNKEEKKYLDQLRQDCNVRMPNNPFQSA